MVYTTLFESMLSEGEKYTYQTPKGLGADALH